MGAVYKATGNDTQSRGEVFGSLLAQVEYVRPEICKGGMPRSIPAFNDDSSTTKEMVLKVIGLAIRKAQINAGLATARFWTWHRGEYDEGLVKIRLRPQQGMAIGGGGPTDEGWQVWGVGWEHVGSCVEMYCTRRGVDCDGPYEQWADYKCPIEDLDLLDGEPGEPGFPMWERVSGGQRDHNAEAMGY